jgi:hypothetical protein
MLALHPAQANRYSTSRTKMEARRNRWEGQEGDKRIGRFRAGWRQGYREI